MLLHIVHRNGQLPLAALRDLVGRLLKHHLYRKKVAAHIGRNTISMTVRMRGASPSDSLRMKR